MEMTISDVLSDAAHAIREYQEDWDDYDQDQKDKIDEVVRAMKAVRIYLDYVRSPDFARHKQEGRSDEERTWQWAQKAALIPDDENWKQGVEALRVEFWWGGDKGEAT